MPATPTKLLPLALGAALLASPCVAVPAPPSRGRPTRTLAVVPFYAPELMWRLNQPLADYLTRVTGERWTLVLPPTHEDLDRLVCDGGADVALLGPVPLARLSRRCGAVPFLVLRGRDGEPVYRSVLLTASPEVTSISSLRGRKVAFFRGSTASHVLPVKMLAEAGLGPGAYEPLFLEGQERILTALLTGKASAGAVKSALHRRFEKEPALRVLAVSEPLPNFAFAARSTLAPAIRERFAAALLRLVPGGRSTEAQIKGWDDELRNGFARPPPGFLDAARATLEAAEAQGHARP